MDLEERVIQIMIYGQSEEELELKAEITDSDADVMHVIIQKRMLLSKLKCYNLW